MDRLIYHISGKDSTGTKKDIFKAGFNADNSAVVEIGPKSVSLDDVMANPEGGTAGQVLTKTASSYEWADPTGGGGTGTFVITATTNDFETFTYDKTYAEVEAAYATYGLNMIIKISMSDVDDVAVPLIERVQMSESNYTYLFLLDLISPLQKYYIAGFEMQLDSDGWQATVINIDIVNDVKVNGISVVQKGIASFDVPSSDPALVSAKATNGIGWQEQSAAIEYTWDGSEEGKTIKQLIDGDHVYKWCKMSDKVYTEAELKASTLTATQDGETETYPLQTVFDMGLVLSIQDQSPWTGQGWYLGETVLMLFVTSNTASLTWSGTTVEFSQGVWFSKLTQGSSVLLAEKLTTPASTLSHKIASSYISSGTEASGKVLSADGNGGVTWTTGGTGGGNVDDVKINGTSIVVDKIANIPLASTTDNGVMASTDKSKLDGIEAGAQKNATNTVIDANYVHTDNNYSTDEKNKLSGISAGAEVNVITDVKVNGNSVVTNKVANITVNMPFIIKANSDDGGETWTVDKTYGDLNTAAITYGANMFVNINVNGDLFNLPLSQKLLTKYEFTALTVDTNATPPTLVACAKASIDSDGAWNIELFS